MNSIASLPSVVLAVAVISSAAACGERADPESARPAPAPVTNAQKLAEPAPKPEARSEALCSAICAHAGALPCGTIAACNNECKQMVAQPGPGCESFVDAFMRCAATQPTAHWQCDVNVETPALRDGYCEPEQAALARCVEKAS